MNLSNTNNMQLNSMDESGVCTFSAGDGHRNFCHSFVTRATVALVSGDPGYTYTNDILQRRTALHKWRVWSVHFASLVGGREGGREGTRCVSVNEKSDWKLCCAVLCWSCVGVLTILTM